MSYAYRKHLLGGSDVPYVWIDAENLWYEIIVKLHGRCNLNCNYCYVYNMADQSWRDKPKVMSRQTIDAIARRIADYMYEHRLPRINILLHGGEPLLAGIDLINYTVQAIRSAVPARRKVMFSMQTNGTLLTETILDALLKNDIKMSISLDGDAIGNRHRLFQNETSSYDAAARGIRLLCRPDSKYQSLYNGLLGVIDLQNDPIETCQHLFSFNPPSIDFLLPLGHWSSPPPGKDPLSNDTPYADWYIKVFDYWVENFSPKSPSIRSFSKIMEYIGHTALKLRDHKPQPVPWKRRVEYIGPWVAGAGVIEVDGSFEKLDAFKSIREGEPALNLNVHQHSMTRALTQALLDTEARQINTLCDTCNKCKIVQICGGGFYVHRFNEAVEYPYLNPSVFCGDLQKLILHIFNYMKRELSTYT